MKPTKPYCAASRNCSEYQVSSYKSAVRSYFDDLEQYANDVNRYHKQATDYVECMADLD